MDGPQLEMKSFDIQKRLIYEAWKKVQANKGAPGVDAVTITEFADNERDNLYKLWNRMSSGSYFPGAVRAWRYRRTMERGSGFSGCPIRQTESPRPQQRCCWKRSSSRSSTTTAMAIVLGALPTTLWP